MNPEHCMHITISVTGDVFVCRTCKQEFPRLGTTPQAIRAIRRKLRHEEDTDEAPEQ